MGKNKALLNVGGVRLVDRVFGRLDSLFEEVLLVAKDPAPYLSLPCRKVRDVYPGQTPLVGIHAGLSQARFDRIFVTGCDMPFLSPGVIRRLCRHRDEAQAVVPRGPAGLEPLHALYSREGLPVLEEILDAGERSILRFLDCLSVREVSWEEFLDIDPEGMSLRNINTPRDLEGFGKQPAEPPLTEIE